MHTVNLAIQILPKAGNGSLNHQADLYAVIDKAIAILTTAGLPYRITPFETVIEGPYDKVMQLAEQAQNVCFENGADEMLVYIKIQRRRAGDVHIEEKTGKYE